MKQRPAGRPASSEQIIRDIKRKTRKQYSAEEKIRIVLDGLRGEDSIAELCRREALSEQAIRVVVETRLPLLPRIGTRRPCESLAITLIQRHFRRAMVFRQSVASTG